MVYVVEQTDDDGNPMCPVCYNTVAVEGQFCSPICYQEFHVMVFDLGEPIEMTYLTMYEQSWYGIEHG